MLVTDSVGTEKGLKAFVKSLFTHYDVDNSNTIEPSEFRKLCLELGYYFKEDEVRCKELSFLKIINFIL